MYLTNCSCTAVGKQYFKYLSLLQLSEISLPDLSEIIICINSGWELSFKMDEKKIVQNFSVQNRVFFLEKISLAVMITDNKCSNKESM